MHMIKYEKNQALVKVYKDKMAQYMGRAEYIKKQVLDKPSQPEPSKGGTGQKKKPTGDGKDEEDEEE